MKNHLGSYECKLCLTLHNNEVGALTSLKLSVSVIEILIKALFPQIYHLFMFLFSQNFDFMLVNLLSVIVFS